MKHFAILIDNQSKIFELTDRLYKGNNQGAFLVLNKKKGALFSINEVSRFIDNEDRHNIRTLTSSHSQSLKSMSSGERKKALLNYILKNKPDYIILVNPFDNLDIDSQADLKNKLDQIAKNTMLIQLVSRLEDILPFTTDFYSYKTSNLQYYQNKESLLKANEQKQLNFDNTIPNPLEPTDFAQKKLVEFEKVSVSFDDRPVLNNIDWVIKKGEFWQLIGPNGSGKSTLLNMITGDSHKGYGQNLTLLGNKKGSGESVWDIKKYIGYFTPSMTDKFKGYHSLENMLISGLHDSIGLYTKPTDIEKQAAEKWLTIIGLKTKKNAYFHELSTGEKRILMLARAMVKHPPLLILDEPTAGLDDTSTKLFIALVNKIACETKSAIIYVSHRNETGLKPQFIYQLTMNKNGSVGKIV